MKRFLILILFALVTLCFAGCGDSGSKDDEPATGSLTVKVTYTGTAGGSAATSAPFTPATQKIYVYLYKTLSDNIQDASNPDYTTSSDVITTFGPSPEQELTIDNILVGEYKVVVFYDWRGHNNNIAGKDDLYAIYDVDDTTYYATTSKDLADNVTIDESSSNIITIEFGTSTFKLLDSGKFQTSDFAE